MKKEIWKDIPGYDGLYQVSNHGRVKSLKFSKERILKRSINSVGYYTVSLYKEGRMRTNKVHKLVTMSFLGHTPQGMKIVVDHINNDKLDNRVENLQLVTQRENATKDKKGGTSNYTGVSWEKHKWRSSIYVGSKRIHLGMFTDEKMASIYYKTALNKIHLYKGNDKIFREVVKYYVSLKYGKTEIH